MAYIGDAWHTTSESSQDSPVLVVRVELGGGRAKDLELARGDDPVDVAMNFCLENDLPEEVLPPLVRHIKESMWDFQPKGVNPTCGAQAKPNGTLVTPRVLKAEQAFQDRISRPATASKDQQAKLARHKPKLQSVSCDGSESPVFDRLYARAKEVQQKLDERRKQKFNKDDLEQRQEDQERASQPKALSSRQPGRSASFSRFKNYGEKLYIEARFQQEKWQAQVDKVKADREAQEAASLTLKPKLSPLAEKLFSNTSSENTWKRLNQALSNQTKDWIMEVKAEQELLELQECTFQPVINRNSEKIVTERTIYSGKQGKPSAYEILYEDASRRLLKQEELSATLPSEYTFTPRTLRFQEDVDTKPAASSLSKRLHQQQQRRDMRLAAAKDRAEAPVDPETGLPLFTPKVGRGPASRRISKQNCDIGEYLYSIRQRQDSRKAQKLAEQRAKREAEAVPHANKRSNALVAGLKAKRFASIFQFLSGGLRTVDLQSLATQGGSELMARLQPDARHDVETAIKMHAEKSLARDGAEGATSGTVEGQVNLAEFTSLMMNVVAASKGIPRAYLLPASTKHGVQEPSFTPAIDKRSKVLAGKLRPKGRPTYEILHQVASEMHSRHIQQLQAQDDARMKECTFAPDMSCSNGKKQGPRGQSPPKGSETRGGLQPIQEHGFKDLEQEIQQVLEEGAQLGLTPAMSQDLYDYSPADSSFPGSPTSLELRMQDDLLQVPDIQRWTSDNEDFVAELSDGAATMHRHMLQLHNRIHEVAAEVDQFNIME